VHHAEGLRRLTHDNELVAALSRDFRDAVVDVDERTMLEFVAKLTRTPQEMERADVEALRGQGFDDRAIHDIVVVAAYYAFVNRVADGLGVELEAGWGEASR
jgi:uncharacterized peroxidase-related enzyme